MIESIQDTYRSKSLSYYTWQRLKKNKLALASVFFIAFTVVVSILGYLITPDSTPNSNNQLLELAIKPPGFKVEMLSVRKNEESRKTNLIDKLINGEESDYDYKPIYQYYFEGPFIVYEEYTGKNPNFGRKVKLNIADVLYAVNKENIEQIGSEILRFDELSEQKRIEKKIDEMRLDIREKNIFTQKFVLGTDRVGRDMLSRLIIGTRISLAVGLISVLISIVIGILLGAIAGYFRGWIDDVIMWIINVVWSIPTLLLVIAVTLILGKGFWQVFIAIGLTMWVEVARLIRGQILSIREKEFVEAGEALGFSSFRLISKHIIPNVLGPTIVIAASNFASAILVESGLSFLGVGAQPPIVSWGSIINSHRGYIIADAAYLAFLPGLAIMLMVLAFTILGNGLRDAIDSKSIDEEHQIMGY